MVTVRFSSRAWADLDSIVAYTIGKWGVAQAARYLSLLEGASQQLATTSELGRACEHIRPGLCRIEVGRHVFFFRRTRGEVLVCRILHCRMLPQVHSIDDEEGELE